MKNTVTWLVPALIALIAGVVVGFNVGQRMDPRAPTREPVGPPAIAAACPEAPPSAPAAQTRQRLATLEQSLSECLASAGRPVSATAQEVAAETPDSDAAAPRSELLAAATDVRPPPSGRAEPPAQRASSLPESFQRFFDTDDPAPAMSALNGRFEGENQDVSWALGMEDQLRRFLLSHEQAPVVQIGAVECRASLCRIWGTQYAGEDTWQGLVADMQAQPWWAFTGSSSSTRSGDEGRSIFLTLLIRAQPGAPGDLP